MRFGDRYDLPEGLGDQPHSPAFTKFLWSYFGYEPATTTGDVDLGFLRDLMPEDLDLARQLIRRNLRLRLRHLIEATSALQDTESIPLLREMLDNETNSEIRLILAGALWKLARDPALIDCWWLDSEKALDLLIDLPNPVDRERLPLRRRLKLDRVFRHCVLIRRWIFAVPGRVAVGRRALGYLNELELGRRTTGPFQCLSRHLKDYRERRNDPGFRAMMVVSLHRWNARNRMGL